VSDAADVVAWCADRFLEAPALINLMDPAIRTRGGLVAKFRERGWHGRVVWTPISLLAGALHAARFGMALARRERPEPMAVWSILQPRHYDSGVSRTVFAALREGTPAAEQACASAVPSRRRAYG
jgi:hypothetical protein